MNWISENKEWLFSGVGVFLIGLLIGNLKKVLYFLRFNLKQGYIISNTISYFRYSDNGGLDYTIDSRRIMSITTLRNREVRVDFPIYTSGILDSSYSLSDPLRMEITRTGDNAGFYNLKIQGKFMKTFLVVSETRRVLNYNSQTRPNRDNTVLYTLFSERIPDNNYSFCGTRIVSKTGNAKIIAEFIGDKKPSRFGAIQISKAGKILTDDNSSKFSKVIKDGNQLAILETRNPTKDSGVYLWWQWE